MSTFKVCVAALALAVCAHGADVQFDLSVEFSGATPPDGGGPWLEAMFCDVVGGVEFTMTSLLAGSTEFVDEWLFNLDPALDPTLLSFAMSSSSGTFGAPTISTAVDAFMADGDGRYDIEVMFDNSPPGDRRRSPPAPSTS